MTEDEIAATVGKRVQDAISFDEEMRLSDRVRAIEYMRGVMTDTPSEKGRSSTTTSDLADNIGWIMPGLMRIFSGSQGVVEYEATRPEEEDQAAQATDYAQYVFECECDGYRILWTWFRDSLQHGNGVAKAWYEVGPPKVKRERFDALDLAQIHQLLQEPDTEIVGQEPAVGEGLFNIELARTETRKRLMIAVVPPEEFLIDRNARTFEDATLLGHRMRKTRSDLVKEGYDKDKVAELPAYSRQGATSTDNARGNDTGFGSSEGVTDLIDYCEVFTRIDLDGDGIAEMVRICAAGDWTAPAILSSEEWDEDEAPYVDLPCEISPHTWQGRSIGDGVMNTQRVNTVLMRNILDNLYLSNIPQRGIDDTKIVDWDELLDMGVGGFFRTKGDPHAAVADFSVPFVAQHALQILMWNKSELQARVGVSRSTPALDGDALVPKTATASAIEQDEGYAKVETIARTFAETGVKKLFTLILKLIVKHQDRAKTIRLRNEWVNFDPRGWNADMDVRVNVGLGTGTRERDLQMLGRVALEQDKALQLLGPLNPVVTPSMWIKTRQRMVAATGLRNPDQYFADISDEDFAQFWQQKQASAPPDPKMIEAQAKIQTDQMKAQGDLAIKREKAQGEMALKGQEMNIEAQLSAAKIAMGGNDSNIRGPGSL